MSEYEIIGERIPKCPDNCNEVKDDLDNPEINICGRCLDFLNTPQEENIPSVVNNETDKIDKTEEKKLKTSKIVSIVLIVLVSLILIIFISIGFYLRKPSDINIEKDSIIKKINDFYNKNFKILAIIGGIITVAAIALIVYFGFIYDKNEPKVIPLGIEYKTLDIDNDKKYDELDEKDKNELINTLFKSGVVLYFLKKNASGDLTEPQPIDNTFIRNRYVNGKSQGNPGIFIGNNIEFYKQLTEELFSIAKRSSNLSKFGDDDINKAQVDCVLYMFLKYGSSNFNENGDNFKNNLDKDVIFFLKSYFLSKLHKKDDNENIVNFNFIFRNVNDLLKQNDGFILDEDKKGDKYNLFTNYIGDKFRENYVEKNQINDRIASLIEAAGGNTNTNTFDNSIDLNYLINQYIMNEECKYLITEHYVNDTEWVDAFNQVLLNGDIPSNLNFTHPDNVKYITDFTNEKYYFKQKFFDHELELLGEFLIQNTECFKINGTKVHFTRNERTFATGLKKLYDEFGDNINDENKADFINRLKSHINNNIEKNCYHDDIKNINFTVTAETEEEPEGKTILSITKNDAGDIEIVEPENYKIYADNDRLSKDSENEAEKYLAENINLELTSSIDDYFYKLSELRILFENITIN